MSEDEPQEKADTSLKYSGGRELVTHDSIPTDFDESKHNENSTNPNIMESSYGAESYKTQPAQTKSSSTTKPNRSRHSYKHPLSLWCFICLCIAYMVLIGVSQIPSMKHGGPFEGGILLAFITIFLIPLWIALIVGIAKESLRVSRNSNTSEMGRTSSDLSYGPTTKSFIRMLPTLLTIAIFIGIVVVVSGGRSSDYWLSQIVLGVILLIPLIAFSIRTYKDNS